MTGFIVTGISGKNDSIMCWIPDVTTPEEAFEAVAKLTNNWYRRVTYKSAYTKNPYEVDILMAPNTDIDMIQGDYENLQGPRHYWELTAVPLRPNMNLNEVHP